MQQISEEYAGKGVKVFAVNQADGIDSVKNYIAEAKLDKLTVLLDANQAVTDLYKALVIPQTVIIAPDGVIHTVHIGIRHNPAVTSAATSQEEALKLIREDAAKMLRAELDELLRAPAAAAK